MSEARAIVFDLDDTLYPRASFLDSGFLAVARRVAADFGVPREAALRLLRATNCRRSGLELQELCHRFALPLSLVPALVSTIRIHRPCICLPEASRTVLAALRPDWRIGILTNGMPSVQRQKIEALGLPPLVDAIVYAEEVGDGRGKPDTAAFRAVLERLAVRADRSVFVGDDAFADIGGAARAGMRSIHVSAQNGPWSDWLPHPDIRLSAIDGVCCAAARLIAEEERRDVA